MTRLEIAVRLMEASYRKSDMMTVTLTPENALDIADRLCAEDRRRTEASKEPDPNRCTKCDLPFCGCAVPTYPSNTPAELAPLVVEQGNDLAWNIHTPDRKRWFGSQWNEYIKPPTGADDVGGFWGKRPTDATIELAESTRPDRPAKEAKPIVMDAKDCQHRYIRQVVTCGVGSVWVCCGCDKEIATPSTLPPPPKPAARWRAASERPETWTPIVMRGVVGARPNTVVEVGSIVYGIGWHDNQVLRCGGEPVMAHEWVPLAELLGGLI